MSLALVHSRAKSGVQAPAVRVEVYLAAGLPVLNMVGLPEAAVRESRDRVRAAISCAPGQSMFLMNRSPATVQSCGLDCNSIDMASKAS